MMSKLSIVIFAILLVNVVCACKKLVEAKHHCRSSLVAVERELTEKYEGMSGQGMDNSVRDEAFEIYRNGFRAIDKLRKQVFWAKTMEVTKMVKTHSGTVIECNVDTAITAAAIADKTFQNLDQLYESAAKEN